ncbi:UNKNOWN [Stylonychia lemnae]|uniref:Transmembrane protein n=1 Tax=Stylonychia lemnae TaxID=5949 RepID=A0A078AUL9_STYLE|nr:UNKNOWN [Stylonychia lemnae]|eukprot:CDW84578.1 UNKNOWN [Stylonychia lemnae]
MLSGLIILSYINIQTCDEFQLDQGDAMAVLFDQMLFDFVSAIMLNMIWWLTQIASGINRASTYYYFIYSLQINVDQIIYPLIIGWILQTITVYLIEKKFKQMFIQTFQETKKSKDLINLVEAIQPMLLVLVKSDLKVLFSNSKFNKILSSIQVFTNKPTELPFLELVCNSKQSGKKQQNQMNLKFQQQFGTFSTSCELLSIKQILSEPKLYSKKFRLSPWLQLTKPLPTNSENGNTSEIVDASDIKLNFYSQQKFIEDQKSDQSNYYSIKVSDILFDDEDCYLFELLEIKQKSKSKEYKIHSEDDQEFQEQQDHNQLSLMSNQNRRLENQNLQNSSQLKLNLPINKEHHKQK